MRGHPNRVERRLARQESSSSPTASSASPSRRAARGSFWLGAHLGPSTTGTVSSTPTGPRARGTRRRAHEHDGGREAARWVFARVGVTVVSRLRSGRCPVLRPARRGCPDGTPGAQVRVRDAEQVARRRLAGSKRLFATASVIVSALLLAACAGTPPGAAKASRTAPRTVTGLTVGSATSGTTTGTAASNDIKAAAESACKTSAESINAAIAEYDAQTGAFPAALSTLTTTKTMTGTTVGPWLRSPPTGGKSYAFTYDPTTGKIGVRAPPSAEAIPYTADPTSACRPA
jgi:hypothetical protein